MLGDLTFAARTLRKSPVFAVTAVITIALGIGASTAIFSVTNAVLLRPLPYPNPEKLVLVWEDMHTRNVRNSVFSNADFFDLRSGTKAFEGLAAFLTGRGPVPAADGTLEQVRLGFATTNFFPVMGARIALGRDFVDADGQPPPPLPPGAQNVQPQGRGPVVAILSYEYWQRRYGGDRTVLGHSVAGPGSAQVVGVLAPGFELLLPPDANQERIPDIWYALRIAYDEANRNNYSLHPIGRLKEGASIDQAQAQADAVAADLRRRFVIHNTAGVFIRLEPMHRNMVAGVRPALLALMGAVIFLLLIACSNVANLLLVRASMRERELAVRAALGGSRWRLIRQMLAEALLLSGLGTLLGLGLAKFGIRELIAIGPANLPRLQDIAIDPTVLAFTTLAGLAAAAIFGVVPALRASRPDVSEALRASGRTSGLGGGRLLRNSVVVIEVALSFVLLIGSGLMFRSFLALQRIDPGFDPRNVLTFLILGGRGPQPLQRAAFVRELETRLRQLPGVEGVTAANTLPLDGGITPIRWGSADALNDPTKFQATDFEIVLPGYFETMRTPLIAGRTFTDADNAPERGYVVIDDKLAAKAFPGESAIGKRILTRIQTPEPVWVEVIGVIAHQRENSLAEEGREQIFFTDGYVGHGRVRRWAVRTKGDVARFAPSIRAEIARKDPHLAVFEVQPMETFFEKARAGTRFSLLLIGVFAGIAALLAGVGLYGVLSTVVRQRTAEIGVRVALGAGPAKIFGLIVGQGLRLSALGIVVGLAAAFGLTRVMTSMLVGVRATDPSTFAAMVVFFLAVALVSSWLPAHRAAGLDPSVALREE